MRRHERVAVPVGFGASSPRFHKGSKDRFPVRVGHTDWTAGNHPQDLFQSGFNVSSANSRTDWLAGAAGGHGAISGSAGHFVPTQAAVVTDGPGPGAYEAAMMDSKGARMGRDARFRSGDRNPRVGPGSYQHWEMQQTRVAPTPTRAERDTWLAGASGGHGSISGSASHHVDRQRAFAGLESPGPGAYEAPSAFSRAMTPNMHQIPLEMRDW